MSDDKENNEEQEQERKQVYMGDEKKPIVETIDDIELELDAQEQADIEADIPESNLPEVDASVMLQTIGQAVCGMVDGVCVLKKVDKLNEAENMALGGAVAGVMPYIAPADMSPKQMAFGSLIIVGFSIVSTRLGQLNKGQPRPPAQGEAENVIDAQDLFS